MRRLIFSIAGMVIALVAYSLLSGPRVTADTPVSVLAADRIVLSLPVSPSIERIVTDLRSELAAMSESETDPRIAAALDRIGGDDELLRLVAESPAEKFDNGEAVATATPLYDVRLGEERVVVTVVTIELVPGYGSTAASRDHEDGHALINEKVAKRCSRDALRTAVESGYQGQSLINYMITLLYESADPVHTKYHTYVARAGYGQHIRYAEQALTDVTGCAVSPSWSL